MAKKSVKSQDKTTLEAIKILESEQKKGIKGLEDRIKALKNI